MWSFSTASMFKNLVSVSRVTAGGLRKGGGDKTVNKLDEVVLSIKRYAYTVMFYICQQQILAIE